ncbi:unnamed protein product, partial [Prorocentrum cordatum]
MSSTARPRCGGAGVGMFADDVQSDGLPNGALQPAGPTWNSAALLVLNGGSMLMTATPSALGADSEPWEFFHQGVIRHTDFGDQLEWSDLQGSGGWRLFSQLTATALMKNQALLVRLMEQWRRRAEIHEARRARLQLRAEAASVVVATAAEDTEQLLIFGPVRNQAAPTTPGTVPGDEGPFSFQIHDGQGVDEVHADHGGRHAYDDHDIETTVGQDARSNVQDGRGAQGGQDGAHPGTHDDQDIQHSIHHGILDVQDDTGVHDTHCGIHEVQEQHDEDQQRQDHVEEQLSDEPRDEDRKQHDRTPHHGELKFDTGAQDWGQQHGAHDDHDLEMSHHDSHVGSTIAITLASTGTPTSDLRQQQLPGASSGLLPRISAALGGHSVVGMLLDAHDNQYYHNHDSRNIQDVHDVEQQLDTDSQERVKHHVDEQHDEDLQQQKWPHDGDQHQNSDNQVWDRHGEKQRDEDQEQQDFKPRDGEQQRDSDILKWDPTHVEKQRDEDRQQLDLTPLDGEHQLDTDIQEWAQIHVDEQRDENSQQHDRNLRDGEQQLVTDSQERDQMHFEEHDNRNQQQQQQQQQQSRLTHQHQQDVRKPATGGLQIFVKIPGRKSICLDVLADGMVDSIMSAIQDKEGIQTDQQRLTYAGKLMEPGRALSTYNVGNEATVYLQLRQVRLLGGMDSEGVARPVRAAPAGADVSALAFNELLEAEVLKHFEVIQAQVAVQGELEAMGFTPHANDPWRRIGVPIVEGPQPSAAGIERRWEIARLLFSCADSPAWDSAERDTAYAAKAAKKEAVDVCLQRLPQILGDRLRLRSSGLPQRQELGHVALDHILQTAASQNEVVATQLSAVLPSLSTSPSVLESSEARLLTQRAFKGEGVFQNAAWDSLVLWAPKDASALGRMLTRCAQSPGSRVERLALRLLVPMELYPGCDTVESMRDLFWHSLLGDKWVSWVRAMSFISYPLEVALDGQGAPRVARQGLLVVTVSMSMARSPPALIRVADPLLTTVGSQCLVVDFPARDFVAVRRLLEQHGRHLELRVGELARSPGSTSDLPRARIKVHFPQAVVALDVRIFADALRSRHFPATVYVGRRSLYSDSSSLLVELLAPEIFYHVWPLCQGAIFVTGKLVAASTNAEPDVWRPVLDQLLAEDPASAVMRARHRPSRRGGRAWVAPEATSRQLDATRRAREAGRRARAAGTATAELSVEGSMGHNPKAVIDGLMQVVAAKLGTQLMDASPSDAVELGSWRWLAAQDPSVPSGRVRLFLSDLDAVAQLMNAVHGRAIQLGGDFIRIAVHKDLLAPLIEVVTDLGRALYVAEMSFTMRRALCETRVALAGPFTGDFKGATWNAQALFARRTCRHLSKARYLRRLAGQHDFATVTESHGSDGSTAIWGGPRDCQCRWSLGTARRAGVGVIVRRSFLELFDSVRPEDWIEVSPGARNPDGDFNWATQATDRTSTGTGDSAGARDAAEERQWQRAAQAPFRFHELHQEAPTHASASARSRLDRAYVNFDASDQLDKQLGCAALEWAPRRTAHRALSFFRRSPVHGLDDMRPIAAEIVRQESWPERVMLEFDDLRASDPDAHQPIRMLLLLMRATRAVSDRMGAELRRQAPDPAQLDDKVGWAMRFIRAAEGRRVGAMRRCLAAYPPLADLVPDPLSEALRSHDGLRPFRQRAVDLARGAAVADLQALNADLRDLSDDAARIRRGRIQVRLQKLRPGRAGALNAVRAPGGTVHADPVRMAGALRGHWGNVFGPRRCDRRALAWWLSDELPRAAGGAAHPGMPPSSDARWKLQRSDVEEAVKSASHSAPGPDGAPFLAWKRLGSVAVDILFRAANDMSAEGQLAGGGNFYEPADTHPLNIDNAENRILASAARLRVEPLLAEWITEMQQGSVVGRSLLSNVVTVDHEMMRCALQEEEGAAILFDFRAAFPNIAHPFLKDVLSHLNLPNWFLAFFDALYQDNRCDLVVGGARHTGFSLQAVVLPDGLQRLPELSVILAEYAVISVLQLNLPETVFAPLFPDSAADMEFRIAWACPGWAGMRVAYRAKYLGFYLGPDRGHRAYEAPLRKFRERAKAWGEVGAGLLYTLTAYAVYVLPVLAYVAQLDSPPDNWKEIEVEAFRRLLPGPAEWCQPEDLQCLRHLGFPKELPDLRAVATAAQCRVAHLEAPSQGGLRATARAGELRRWRADCDDIMRAIRWSDWFGRSFAAQLASALALAENTGATPAAIECRLSNGSPRPFPRLVDTAVRRGFQREVRQMARPDP